MRSSTSQDNDLRHIISTDDSQFTWLWWWLLLRLSKHQSVSPQTVLLRTTLTWTIIIILPTYGVEQSMIAIKLSFNSTPVGFFFVLRGEQQYSIHLARMCSSIQHFYFQGSQTVGLGLILQYFMLQNLCYWQSLMFVYSHMLYDLK